MAGLSKGREEQIAKGAEYEKANNPVDRVDVDYDHVHVETPTSRVVLKVNCVDGKSSSMGELASHTWARLPLETLFKEDNSCKRIVKH